MTVVLYMKVRFKSKVIGVCSLPRRFARNSCFVLSYAGKKFRDNL